MPLVPCARWSARLVVVVAVFALVTGCPSLVPPDDTGNGNGNGNGGGGTGRTRSIEPNETFGQATPIALDANSHASIADAISSSGDVDVYQLGPFTAGDRIVVDVGTGNNGLDTDVAIFDADGELVYENDDRNFNLGQLDSFINHVIRHDSSPYYVAISASPLNNDPAAKVGSYDMAITVTRGGIVPATVSQIVVLDDNGGSLSVAGTTYSAGPFNTGDIAAAYAGETQDVLNQIIATIQQNYDGLGLQVLVASRDMLPGGCVASTVLLGGRNPDAYGLSEQVDLYDADLCDNAVVFTDMFTPRQFGNRILSATQLGTTIGNVVAHEVGHLLGLNHVSNVKDLMDTTGGADTFLLDQVFTSSALHSTIFPIGYQDGWQLLMETLRAQP